jgi:hypothetical protein
MQRDWSLLRRGLSGVSHPSRALTRRSAMTLLAGGVAACGGGGEIETLAQAAGVGGGTTAVSPAPVTPSAPTPAPTGPVAPGMLNRIGLALTFEESFSSLAYTPTASSPLNGKWRTWLNHGDKDSFYTRTLHQDTGDEQQYYLDPYILDKLCAAVPNYKTHMPFSLADGPNGKVLRITARKMESAMVSTLRDKLGMAQGLSSYQSTKYWSSGLLSSHGAFAQKYGVFEARMRTGGEAGNWPAFWMLNDAGGWPPEIDIVDNYPQQGAKDRWVSGGVISPGSGFGPKDGGRDGKVMPYQVRDAWHTVTVEWDAKHIVYYSNDVEYFRTNTPSNFNSPMFIILNLAIVGQDNKWADRPLASASSMALEIDYVRAWKRV